MLEPDKLVELAKNIREAAFERNEVAPIKSAIEDAAKMGHSSVTVYDPHIRVIQILEKQGFSTLRKGNDGLFVTISWGRTLGETLK